MAVSIELTPAGFAAPDSVVCALMAYLGMLARRPPSEELWRELRDVAALRFRFCEEEPEIDVTAALPSNRNRST